jgi:predicted adenine nucleotide alpha hydrolase (AANH) superfamily ATPase
MKILLHACCGNCSIFPVKVLREANHDVTGYFFNPNIHPYQEYRKRLDTMRDYAERTELPVTYVDEYGLVPFLQAVSGEPGTRCDHCYFVRLENTARFAAKNGFDAFTSSLLYSRYQNHDTITRFGEQLGEEYGIKFHYDDFRTGWREGIETSKSMGLYRQQYCGCIYSEMDRYHPKSRN